MNTRGALFIVGLFIGMAFGLCRAIVDWSSSLTIGQLRQKRL